MISRKIVVPTTIAAIAVLTAALLLAPSVLNSNFAAHAASHKDFGQCNKTQNQINHDAGVNGKAGADSRKAACSALKP